MMHNLYFSFQISGDDGDGEHFTFEITHTLATDAGRYVCIATNADGVEKCSVSLNVKALENTENMDFRTLLKSRYTTEQLTILIQSLTLHDDRLES